LLAFELSQDNFYTYFESSLGYWHVKTYKGYVYVVVTSPDHSMVMGIECLDLLSTNHRAACAKWIKSRRREAQEGCCQSLADHYHPRQSTSDDDAEDIASTAVWSEETRKDDCGGKAMTLDPEYVQCGESLRAIYRKLDSMKNLMHDNIMGQLDNIESAEECLERAEELKEQCKVFKKRAKKLRRNEWLKRYSHVSVAVVSGAALGFFAGGPAGAAVMTGMESVAAAQALEAGVGAIVLGGGSYIVDSAASWAFSQKLVVLP
jgi:hypothetical protein